MNVQSEVTLVAATLPASLSSETSLSYQTMQPSDNQSPAILSLSHPTSPSSRSFLITDISMSPYNGVQTMLPEYATHDRRTVSNPPQPLPCQLPCRPILTLTSAVSDSDGGSRMKECCNQGCCLHCLITVTTFRWVLMFFAIIGICCIISGVVLGAMHMSVGSSFITLSIMFIGLGVLLVIVIGIGWRCTPPGHEPCHLLLNLSDHWILRGSRGTRGRGGSRRRGDQNQWFGGMLYPEFEFRAPPPSYNESALDYQQTILRRVTNTPQNQSVNALPETPPPIYQSETGTLYRPAHSILHRFVVTLPEPPVYRTHDTRRHRSHHITQTNIIRETSNNVLDSHNRGSMDNHRGNTGGGNVGINETQRIQSDTVGDETNVRHGVIEDMSYIMSVSQHILESNTQHEALEREADREIKLESTNGKKNILVSTDIGSDSNSIEAVDCIPLDIDSAWLDKTISRDTTLNSITESSSYALYETNNPVQVYSQPNPECLYDINSHESRFIDVAVDIHDSVAGEYNPVKSIDSDKSSIGRCEVSNDHSDMELCTSSDGDSGNTTCT